MNTKLHIGQMVGSYRVEKFIKASSDNRSESYFVVDDNGKKALMKLYSNDAKSCATEYGERVIFAGNLSLLPVVDNGEIDVDGVPYHYIVREFVDGERLSDLINCGKRYSWEQAALIILQVMSALKQLHSQERAVIHNDVTTRNIIIKEDGDRTLVYVIGMGHLSRRCNGKATFCTTDLNNWYRAPETFKGIYDEQSDIFSVGAVLYTMIEGVEPWSITSETHDVNVDKNLLKSIRSVGNEIIDRMHITEAQKAILGKMIALDYDKRYRSVEKAMNDIVRGRVTESIDMTFSCRELSGGHRNEPKVEEQFAEERIKPCRGGGFADVAGMADVKRMLYKDVMFVMQNKDKVDKYRLKSPNGVLFYGPPGCGKTFIAEKFAEESQLNFMMVKASDLGSIYIHGTQGKIAQLFAEAAKKAPTVICFDELDGMVPNRANTNNEGVSGEVNEFLCQLNNCSERGIFVIGTSNRPEKIDPAILRTGRLDKMVYIPMPDLEARKEMFKIQLDGRYCDESINIDELAKRSEGYVASDISYIVNECALEAAMSDVPIDQSLILGEIHKARRSVTSDDIAGYERVCKKFEQQTSNQTRRVIGF